MSDRKDGGPVRYEIRHINDLLRIPADRIDSCLSDVKAWYEITNIVVPFMDSGLLENDGFTWIDDGIDGISDVIINGQSLADAMLSKRADKEVTHDP